MATFLKTDHDHLIIFRRNFLSLTIDDIRAASDSKQDMEDLFCKFL